MQQRSDDPPFVGFSYESREILIVVECSECVVGKEIKTKENNFILYPFLSII